MSPSSHNCQQKPLCHISTTFSCCQNYKLGHVGKIKSAIIKANQEGKSAAFVSQMHSKSLDGKKKCRFEVPIRSQRARPVNPRLCKIASHTND